MTFRYGDWVRITNNGPNTGNFTDANPAVGYGLFGSIPNIVNGDTGPYSAWDGAGNREEGHFVYNAGSPATLTRNVTRSTNSNAAVNFTGNVYIWCSINAGDVAIGPATGTGAPVLQNSPTITGNELVNQMSSAYTPIGSASGGFGVNLALTQFFTATLTGDSRPIFQNCPNNSGYVFQFFLLIVQDGTGGHALNFNTNNTVQWPGGSSPANTTAAGKGDLWAFTTFNGGTDYIGTLVAPNISP